MMRSTKKRKSNYVYYRGKKGVRGKVVRKDKKLIMCTTEERRE